MMLDITLRFVGFRVLALNTNGDQLECNPCLYAKSFMKEYIDVYTM